MAKNKMSLSGDIFEEYAAKLEKLGGSLKATTERALAESAEYVNDNLKKDIKAHKRTRQTEKSLRDEEKVKWSGTTAEIGVGFDISHGGLASIFLMYGTPRHGPIGKKPGSTGHPGTKQDKKLYNDVYGSKTQKEVKEIQEKIFAEEVEKLMNK